MKAEELMLLLGKNTTDKEIQSLFSYFGPISKMDEDGDSYIDGQPDGFDFCFIFQDEGIVNKEEFFDIGDGEQIFVSLVLVEAKKNKVTLPYGIKYGYTYEQIVATMGRPAEHENTMGYKFWKIENNGRIIVMIFEFKNEGSYCDGFNICLNYGQDYYSWINNIE